MTLTPPLDKQVQYLKGVGPKRAELLRKLGIVTLWDLVTHFPREHDDRTERVPIGRARPGTSKTLRGTIQGFEVSPVGRNLAMGRALLGDGTGYIWAVWFRRMSFKYDPFAPLSKKLTKGAALLVHGPIEHNHNSLQVRVDEYDVLSDQAAQSLHVDRLVPLYDMTEGLDARWFRELMWNALQENLNFIRDSLPSLFLEKHELASLPWAIQNFHFPSSKADLARARRRLAFEEFFFLELAIALARERRQQGPAALPCVPTRGYLSPFRQGLGFDFTPPQKRVINEIFADMARDRPMNRLLQGDVGSGKTVVALSAMLLAVENGRQAVLMAPTEILAEQHFLTLNKFLKGLGGPLSLRGEEARQTGPAASSQPPAFHPLRWALFTSNIPKKQRDVQIAQLKSGELNLAVGTHALIQEDVEFQKLGLSVIDEQHRFGVRQRAKLQGKAEAPHVLIMTATPIPRTLALTLYGDLSISTIDALPPGRRGISTHWTLEDNAVEAVRKAVKGGRQAYIVFPLVEESNKLDLRAAVKEWERLKSRVFPDFQVGLLHGRMKPQEKEQTMAKFSKGEIQILVATPVIEVGIDVPNATIMVIMHAERFGLAQLHQLRGRVGRGPHPSACYLISDTRSEEPAHRLRLLCQTLDGFKLAEEDLQLRGPGEFIGEAQHGVPLLKVGNLVRDAELIVRARDAAFRIVQEDPRLDAPDNRAFREEMRERFGGKLFLGQVA